MFTRIMLPVDLAHVDRLEKAVGIAVELARRWNCPLTVVGVTADTPGPVAHTPTEFGEKLEAYAAELRGAHGVEASAHVVLSNDPGVDLTKKLIAAVADVGADLVVMASHLPGLAEHVFASHAGGVASHAPVSVFVVR